MNERAAQKRVRTKGELPGRTKRGLRIEDDLYQRLNAMAKRQETTITELINRALAREVGQDIARQEDAAFAPLVEQLLKDETGRLEIGLRNLIARVAHEVLRNQYILCNFLATAGINGQKVDSWRRDGHDWAVKELRNRPDRGPGTASGS